jgi:tetratricopeptide (TPR) repeat protein
MGVAGEVLTQALGLHQAKRFDEASRLYNALLNRNPFDEALLFLLGDLYLRTEQSGLAVNLLTNLLQIKPDHGEAWCNLGIGYRLEDRYDEAIRCWNKALELQGDTVQVCSNMAGLYSDRADPSNALAWINRALAIDPTMIEAHWQRGLSMLTLRNWAEGWPEYEYRLKLENFDTRKSIDLPYWDFSPTEHLYIHGEQGIGDEVMFLSCLEDVLPLAKRVTLEVNAQVAAIAKQTWPEITVVTDVAQAKEPYTAKVALASLAARFRRSERAFPGIAYLRPSDALVRSYRAKLAALGPRPWIALAWHGGSKRTRVEDRSMGVDLLKPIIERYTCVSGQYEHTNPYVAADRAAVKLHKIDDDCCGKDLHAQAALFKAVDAVVTVQQTAVHVAGAVGAQTFVMVNSRPHWRYHITGQMPWYKSVELIRQKQAGEWAPVIKIVEDNLAYLARVHRAKSVNA